MIELRGVSKTVESGGRPLTILHPLDFSIPSGQFVAVVGPSGSGKSTLLGLLAGLDARGIDYVSRLRANATLDRLAEHRPKSLKFVCLVSCPEGLAALARAHPDVPAYTAAIDRQLDEHGYILPGLGDAGDRIFGTK
mgnify:CR=1 FL=1